MSRLLRLFNIKKNISLVDIVFFFRQLATLIQADVPIIKSLETLEKSQTKPALYLLLLNLRKDLLAGNNLFASFSNRPIFNPLTCHLLKLGEQTGNLAMIIHMIADHYERQLKQQQMIKQALFYPSVVGMVALGMTWLMLIWIVPKFAELYADMTTTLPLLTRCLFSLSTISQYLSWLAIPIILVAYCFKHKLAPLYNKALKLPLFKRIIKQTQLAQFTRQLAIGFAAGLPITESLILATNATTHPSSKRLFALLHNQVHAGLSLSKSIAQHDFFPTMLLQMVKIGEESGQLDIMLHQAADFLEADIAQWMKRFNQLLEPLIMLVLGVLIGGLVIGMYLPIFNLGSTL